MEYLDVCDAQGMPTGAVVERGYAHREGIRHRTAHVWILRRCEGRTEILLQKRSQSKDSFPGLYDTSSAGHIPAGMDFVPSALREMEEELGVRARAEDLQEIGFFRIQYEKLFHGSLFCDNEYSRVFLYREPLEISALRLQESEVEEVRWFDLEEALVEIPRRRDRFCVPLESLRLLERFLKAEGREA